MTTPRPKCAFCGEPYGKRATTEEVVRWETPIKKFGVEPNRFGPTREGVSTYYQLDGQPTSPPPYRGNGMVIRETEPYLSADNGRMVMRRYVWDGETYWTPYEPFCTLRCALAYARRAYNAVTRASVLNPPMRRVK